ncbi:MAG TPA: carbon-nitrogen hydrolase family protein [Planctomycetota bacterium]
MLLAILLLAQDVQETKLRMALVSMKCLLSDLAEPAQNRKNIEANLERHRVYIDQAAAQGAEFVGFPELSINGYRFSPNMTWLSLDGPEVRAVAAKAVEKKLYVSVGLAERDADGKKWNTQIVIGPDGKIVGKHHKIWLTAEGGHTERGTSHDVFEVKGVKMGIVTCADGSDFLNLKAVADKGAKIIYGPHANTTGSTLAGWYRFRARWGGEWDGKTVAAKTSNDGPEAQVPSGGWAAALNVHAALHNHAGLFDPPVAGDVPNRFAAGAWFIGPDGKTLAQQPSSTERTDSREHLLIQDVTTRSFR